jgi:hypothetical protein
LAASSTAAVVLSTTTCIRDSASLWYVMQPVCLYVAASIVVTPVLTTCCAIGPVASTLSSS